MIVWQQINSIYFIEMIKVCPNPIPWNNVFNKLSEFANDHENLSKPPVPLILGGWVSTNDLDKKAFSYKNSNWRTECSFGRMMIFF